MQAWKGDYPWLQLAFKHVGPSGRAASDAWRARIEDDLNLTLDYKLRPDGTATVWCGMSGFDFHHEPTPKELLEGLADAYRREVKRMGATYPTRTTQWKLSEAVAAHAANALDPLASVSVSTRDGPIELAASARNALLTEVRKRASGGAVVRAFEAAGDSTPVELDRVGKIVLFDAIWVLAENAGGYERIDPQLRQLQDTLKVEIAANPAGKETGTVDQPSA